jgi:hypothetical protein
MLTASFLYVWKNPKVQFLGEAGFTAAKRKTQD